MSGPGGQKPEVRMLQGHAPLNLGGVLPCCSCLLGVVAVLGAPWLIDPSLPSLPCSPHDCLRCVSVSYKDRVLWG